MAIDSRNKRASAINVGSPWRGLLPDADGTIDQADRQQVAFMYGGILAGAAFVATHSSLEFAAAGNLLHFRSSGKPLELAADGNQLEFAAKGPNG